MSTGVNTGCNIGEHTGTSGARSTEVVDVNLTATLDALTITEFNAVVLVAGAGWTIELDFESGADGQHLIEPDDGEDLVFSSPYSCFYSTDTSVQGSNSIKMLTRTGGDTWGLVKNFTPLQEGDEVWMRCYLRYPSGFNYTHTSFGLKTFATSQDIGGRLWTLITGQAASGGFNHVNSDTGNSFWINNMNGMIVDSNEITTDDFSAYWYPILLAGGLSDPGGSVPCGEMPTPDTWMHLEHYVKLSSTTIYPTGGIWRVWQDGTLIFEDTHNKTISNSGRTIDTMVINSYWNGLIPADQHAYTDEVKITTVEPTNVDAFGNKMIGPTG